MSVLRVTGQIFFFRVRTISEFYLITELAVGSSALQFRILDVPGSYIISPCHPNAVNLGCRIYLCFPKTSEILLEVRPYSLSLTLYEIYYSSVVVLLYLITA